jgi:Ca2+-binding EF-hand superfamily protein
VRNKRLWVLLTVCVALALAVANTALTQFQGPGRGGRGGRGGGMGGPGGPGGGGPGGGGGRMGGGRMNPDMIFNMMSQGKDYIVISEIRMNRDRAEEYAQRKGITNGQLTREQFADYLQERFAERQASRAAAPGGAGSGDPAKDYFDRLDRNRDGVLTDDEIPGPMRADLGKWDSNRDGKIQLEEYRAYFKANAPAEATQAAVNVTAPNPLEELDKRATVYRAGNLPPELQRTWFEECDTDKDGQVGLYEWKASGYPVSEFRAMDANGDGFITAEEALRWVRKNGGGNTSTATAAAGFGRGQGGGGRWQGMGGGPGGWGPQGLGGQGGGGRWQGGGGFGPGNNRGPAASADGGYGDRQPGVGRGGRGGRGGGGGRRQGGGGGPRGGGMMPGWSGSN